MAHDPWEPPSTSAGHTQPGFEEVVAAEETQREARNLLLSRLLIGFACCLCFSFVFLVGSGARAHRIDRDLFTTWWNHHSEYDCCVNSAAPCAPGIGALRELQERLRSREDSARELVAARVAAAIGLQDLDVSDAPTSAADVDRIVATCPVLQTGPRAR